MRQHHSKKDTGHEVDDPTTEVEDVEALTQALVEEKARAETNMAGWQRSQADFANYKRRVEQEMQEIGKLSNANLALNLLTVLDDLERALSSVPDDLADVSWVNGIVLIDRKFRGALEAIGLSTIEALGEPFDPNVHEAVMQAKGEEGIVVKELEKGYRFQDRIIRPTKVVVGSGEE
ncbi:MAG: nucleotide exchange factor GrpE [Chloroflexi bacterium]|nr:nucleotide exchange factor GrpE [Chloroflexota bacterium]